MKTSLTDMQALAVEIEDFLGKYAKMRADYDPTYDEPGEGYSSPDASILYFVARQLRNEALPLHPWSSWASGGFHHPQGDKVGTELLDALVKKITNIK